MEMDARQTGAESHSENMIIVMSQGHNCVSKVNVYTLG